MRVLNQAFDQPLELEEQAADPLAGGMMRGYQCGMTWGAALAAGAQVYRLLGNGPRAEAQALRAAHRIVEAFRAQNKYINCFEITQIDLSSPTPGMVARFLLKSSVTGSCFGMAARYAKTAFREIQSGSSESPLDLDTPAAPISCAAMLAQKLGASDLHTVMAAGLAGGIGLSGNACGALGAALWIRQMKDLREGEGKTDLTQEIIEKFSRCSNGEFECSRIVGRKFEDLDDHARYVRAGGCSKLIAGLAAQ